MNDILPSSPQGEALPPRDSTASFRRGNAVASLAETVARAELAVVKASAILTQVRQIRARIVSPNAPSASMRVPVEPESTRLVNNSVTTSNMVPMAADGSLITDMNGIIQEANQAASLMLGMVGTYLIRKPLMNFVPLTDRPALRQRLLAMQGTDSSAPEIFTEFVQIIPRKGEWFEAALRFSAIRGAHTGRSVGIRWILRDLSDRGRAETERYRLLVDSLEDYAVFLLDNEGRITSWNHGAEQMFRYSEVEILGQPFAQLFPAPETDAGLPEKELSLARKIGRVQEENWLMRKKGERFFAQGSLIALPGGGSAGRVGFAKIIRDITERQLRDEDLRVRQTRLELALQAAHAATWDWNLDTGVCIWSPDYWGLLNISDEAPPSYETWVSSVHPEDRDKVARIVTEAIRMPHSFSHEHRIAHPPETGDRWLLSFGQPLAEPTGRIYRVLGITMDITERKETERHLEARVRERTSALAEANSRLSTEVEEHRKTQTMRDALAKRLNSAQEEERRRISRELHDQMGQHLTGLALGLRSLENELSAGSEAHALLLHLRGVTEEVGRDVHRIAIDLRPTAIDDLGLLRALQGYASDWAERTGIQLDLEASGFGAEERLPDDWETALYRIAQEALNNIARHSRATQAGILLLRQEKKVVLIIEDNGQGFDATGLGQSPKNKKTRRLGLIGIQERVNMIGGTLTIESNADGGGTTIYVRTPQSVTTRKNR